MEYHRPVAMTDPARPPDALPLAGGWCWFNQVEVLTRGGARLLPAHHLPSEVLDRLTAPRRFGGLSFDQPRIMGILNVTPDSFSDGGLFLRPEAAVMQARLMAAGADIIDIGGESTRPGAAEVAADEEQARTAPVIAALRAGGLDLPLSIDTRKADVAAAALAAGAAWVNDVTALRFDPAMAGVVAKAGCPVILMHSVATPATMQDEPFYDDVLLDVYDALAERVRDAEAAGIARDRIAIDPGIGFGKTLAHNLELLRRLPCLVATGFPILLGASRKSFINRISPAALDERLPGSLAAALTGAAAGVGWLRVHDVAQTRQAVAVWAAIHALPQPPART